MWRSIKFYAVTILLVALAAAALYYRYFPPRGAVVNRTVDAPAVLRQIQSLRHLMTVRYNIQKVIGLKEEKVPFGSESVLLLVQAKVLGGIDLAELTTQDVHVAADRSVTIRLPPPKIMDVSVEEKETKVWDRSKTWWTPWVDYDPELEQKARLAALEAVQQAALQMGILSNAQLNAQTALGELLRALGIESVEFSAAH